MNALVFISVILFVLYLQLGLYVLWYNYKSALNRYFFGLSLCFAIWSFFCTYTYLAPTAEMAIYWDNWASIGYAMFPAFMVAFASSLTNFPKSGTGKNLLFVVFLVIGLFFVLSTFGGYWQFEAVIRGNITWHFYHNPKQVHYIIFYTYILSAFLFVVFALLKWRKRIRYKHEVYQYRIVFVALIMFIVPALYFDIILPAHGQRHLPVISHIVSVFWLSGIAIAILRFQLLVNFRHLIAGQVINRIKEIIFFVDIENRIVKSNSFTNRLLGIAENEIPGKSIFECFENKILIGQFLEKIKLNYHFGPANLTLTTRSGKPIDTSLFFVTVKNDYDDILGCIIYGHDNRENLKLIKEIAIKQDTENKFRALGALLESKVKDRTLELTNSYKELQIAITERVRIEERIRADIAEKEVLIHEIHNRVQYNMELIIALIKSQINKHIDATARAKFMELTNRIKSLLLVHQNLYLSISYSDVDFAGFIKTLARELIGYYKKEDSVELRIEASEVFLDIAYAIPVGIILNELISNSLKHGFSTQYISQNKGKPHILHIRYASQQSDYFISVSDTGKGLHRKFSQESLNTSGLPLVELLVKDQINGNLNIYNSARGTNVEISFNASK